MIEKINPQLQGFHFVLASKSPRRKELLRQFGLNFSSKIRPVDESFPENLNPQQVAEDLACKKGDAFGVNDLNSKTMIITADTVVATGKKILGKPGDYEHAKQMLYTLSGKTHEVITAVLLKTSEKQLVFSAITKVRFKLLSEAEIKFYIETFKPYDKAGAYGIQEWIGFAAIEHIEGSYFNVVGLPMHALYQKLIEW